MALPVPPCPSPSPSLTSLLARAQSHEVNGEVAGLREALATLAKDRVPGRQDLLITRPA